MCTNSTSPTPDHGSSCGSSRFMSITMQIVKNVMLYREKTLSRKLQELFLTWYIETVLEKDRIFEIYVNAIEYGYFVQD